MVTEKTTPKSTVRLDRFDLNLLVVLDALLEERNVTRASARLHIGQSAASGALARLREYFGDELLVPVGRRLELTPLAMTLVEPVRDTLLRARATIARKPGFDPATAERRFAVCASDYVITVMLAEAMRHVAQRAPGLALDVSKPPKDVVETFERGGIDLMVMPEQYASKLQHPQARLFEDTQVCMAWTGHAGVGDSLTMETYMDLGHVAVRFGDERSAFEEWFLPRYGKQRRIEASLDNFATAAQVVIGTQRVATLHRRMALHFAQHLPVRVLELPFSMPPLVEVMVWPRYLAHDPAHVWLREQLLGTAAGLTALAEPAIRAPSSTESIAATPTPA